MPWIMDIDTCQLETFCYCIYFTEKMVACFLSKAHGHPSFRFDLLNDINYDTYSGY